MSSVVNATKGKRFDLSKKIQKNPKYDHIRSSLDTGASMSKYMAKVEEIKENYKFRKDEIFKRMKATTFVQLVIQVNRLMLPDGDEYGDVPPTPSSMRPDTADREVQMIQDTSARGGNLLPMMDGDTARSETQLQHTQRSTLQSVARGVGEMDINQPVSQAQVVQESCPYLLLDVRDLDDYEMCHIISAYNYPKANLSRANHYETKEMLRYKNKTGCIVIVYDECENIGHAVATTLVQRGYDNLFMLSGGLKVATNSFQQSLVTGTLPPSITHAKPREFLPASQRAFTIDDIDCLEMQLDNALEDKSLSSMSRLSKPSSRASREQTSNSRASAMSGRSQVHHNKPFVA